MQTPPPNYSQYPRGPQGLGGMGYRGPGIYFDFINDAFRMVTRNAGVYVVGSLIAIVVFYLVQIPFSMAVNMVVYGSPMGGGRVDPDQFFSKMGQSFGLGMVAGIIPTAILHTFMVGISLCAVEEADTGSTSMNTMFSGFRSFLPMIGTGFLMSVLMNIGMLGCIVGYFIVGGLLIFAPIYTVAEGLNPIEALQKSVEVLKSYWGPMAGFYFVASLVSGLGVCACGVGLLFTMPILYICVGLHYREFRGPINTGFQVQPGPQAPMGQ